MVSANVVEMWTNFAVGGSPGFSLEPWNLSSPNFASIGTKVTLKKDYTKEYHVAQNNFLNSVTTKSPTTTVPAEATTSASCETAISHVIIWFLVLSISSF